MHELPIIKEILRVSLKYAHENNADKLHKIVLGVGEIHDLVQEWVLRYFEFASNGTLAEGARIQIIRYPIVCRCIGCGENILVRLETTESIFCPKCGGSDCDIISGKELRIENIVIQCNTK